MEAINSANPPEAGTKFGTEGHSQLGAAGWPPGGSQQLAGQLTGQPLDPECSGRPALQSFNKTVNQLKVDTMKAYEFDSW